MPGCAPTQYIIGNNRNNAKVLITNPLHHPQLIEPVAKMIYDEFWVDVADGMSQADLAAHLQTAHTARHMANWPAPST